MGSIFFPDENFVTARRQLKRIGDIADGYEALEFIAKNAPFREDPNISKLVILVTNMGRSVLASRTNLTREVMFTLFQEKQILLDVVVDVQMGFSHNTREIVLGLHDINQASVVRSGGNFERLMGGVFFTSSAGNTIQDYVSVALSLQGSAWPINLLKEEDLDVLISFAKALIAANQLRSVETVEICKRCECVEEAVLQCREAVDQKRCRCLVNGTLELVCHRFYVHCLRLVVVY